MTILAAIDLGTNSFHLVVANVHDDGNFEVLTREKEPVRLGSGSGDMKVLLPEAIDRGITALDRMRQGAQTMAQQMMESGEMQAGQGPGLPLKALHQGRVSRQPRRQDLDGQDPVEVQMGGAVDPSHAPFADDLFEPVLAQERTGGQQLAGQIGPGRLGGARSAKGRVGAVVGVGQAHHAVLHLEVARQLVGHVGMGGEKRPAVRVQALVELAEIVGQHIVEGLGGTGVG